jgi:hypothetical protein
VSGRRVVRVSTDFFAQLDSQLGALRGPAGEPSATDFIVVDLPTIVERFAMHFDDLPEAVEGVPGLRVVVGLRRLRIAARRRCRRAHRRGHRQSVAGPRETTHRPQTDHKLAVFDNIRRHRPTPENRC